MLLNKRTLAVFNIEYEMPGPDGKQTSWKANILAHNNPDDAVEFIRKSTGKYITVLSISLISDIDAVTDKSIEYIVSKSGFQTKV